MSAPNIYTIYYAYLISNPFKGYIGFDSNWPKRKYEHQRAKDKLFFHRALRKYTPNLFQWDILYQSLDYEYTKDVMEEHFIREYHTHKSEGGYNLTYGGEGALGRILSESTKRKIGIKSKLTWRNPILRQQLSTQRKNKPLLATRGNNHFRSKQWIFIDPQGNQYSIEGGFGRFCKDHNLNLSYMWNLFKGTRNPTTKGRHKGWKVTSVYLSSSS